VRLFEDRAQLVEPGFEVRADNASSVVSICQRLDGIPLAVELAAAGVAVMAVPAIATRLETRMDLPGSSTRRRTDRHRTMQATVEWSYDLLDEEERRLFRALSVFARGCTQEAVEAVSDGADPLETLASLVRKSLVVWDADAGRYRLLEVIGQYSADRLADSPSEEDRVRAAHAAYYRELAVTAEPEFVGARQGVWFERLRADHDNVCQAVIYLAAGSRDLEGALLALVALRRYWVVRGVHAEWTALAEPLLQQTDLPAWLAGRAHMAAGFLTMYQDTTVSAVHAEKAIAAGMTAGDQPAVVEASALLACASSFQGHKDPGLGAQTLQMSRELGDPALLGVALMAYGLTADHDLARRAYGEALEVTADSGDQFVRMSVVANMSGIHKAAGDREREEACCREAVELAEGIGYQTPLVWANLAEALLDKGDIEGSAEALGVALSGAGSSLYETAGAIESVARYATATGDHTAAAILYGFAESAIQRAGMLGSLADPTPPVRDRQLLERELGSTFDDYHRVGESLSWEDAVQAARRCIGAV
jgi:tetratricopeptide (TPR) repeat protein